MSDTETGPGDVFNVDRIRRLVELMEEHDLREVDLRQSEQRIRLSRGVVLPMLPAAPLRSPPPPPRRCRPRRLRPPRSPRRRAGCRTIRRS